MPSGLTQDDIMKFKDNNPKDIASFYSRIFLRELAGIADRASTQKVLTSGLTNNEQKLGLAEIIVKGAQEYGSKKKKNKGLKKNKRLKKNKISKKKRSKKKRSKKKRSKKIIS